MTKSEKAKELFLEGYNCAQSLTGAYASEMGLDFSAAVKLASSFGGGMGRMREVCGAVSGMFLADSALASIDGVNAAWSPQVHAIHTYVPDFWTSLQNSSGRRAMNSSINGGIPHE